MSCCGDCMYFKPTGPDEKGECQIAGPTRSSREAERCPSRTFRPKQG